MSGITRDRTILGYEGDWDENSSDFQNWQSWLNNIGLETYMDSDKAYKLRLLPEEIQDGTTNRTTTGTTPSGTPP